MGVIISAASLVDRTEPDLTKALQRAWEVFRARFLVYGESGAGKTPFLTRLPDAMFPALYIASDSTSVTLESILPQDIERIVPYAPEGKRVPLFSKPVEEYILVARAQWETWGPGCMEVLGREAFEFFKRKFPDGLRTIILDTATQATESFFEWYRENEKVDSRGQAADPRSFYNKAQMDLQTVFTAMDTNHRFNASVGAKSGMHLLWGAQVGENGDGASRRVGPQTVGSKGPLQLPHRFGTTLYLRRTIDPIWNPNGNMRVLMAPEGPYIATIKKADEEGDASLKKEMLVRNTHRAVEEVYEYLLAAKCGLLNAVPAPVK